MKNLRKILDALATLRRVPSAAILDAWSQIKTAITAGADVDSNDVDLASIELIDSIIIAVVGAAKDDEDKATKPGKADKPAT